MVLSLVSNTIATLGGLQVKIKNPHPERRPLKEFIADIFSHSYDNTSAIAIRTYRRSILSVPHEFLVIILMDNDTPNLRYLRIDRGPGSPSGVSLFQVLNAPHPPAHDTYLVTTSLEAALGDDANKVSNVLTDSIQNPSIRTRLDKFINVPLYVLVKPIPICDLGIVLATFQAFSPWYILNAEQCFWLCSCITFISKLFYQTRNLTRWELSNRSRASRSDIGWVLTGTAWGIRLKQEWGVILAIAEISAALFAIDHPTPIPIEIEQDWRVSRYACPLQVLYFSSDILPLKALIAKGLGLSVGSTLFAYLYVSKWEVIMNLFACPDIANTRSVTHQAVVSLIKASHHFARNILTTGSTKPKGLSCSSSIPSLPMLSTALDLSLKITDALLRNPILDPGVEMLAHIIGSKSANGLACYGSQIVLDECPQVVDLLLDIVAQSSGWTGFLISADVLEAATHAIRNISMVPAGYSKLRNLKAIDILSLARSSDNISNAIHNLSTPPALDPAFQTRPQKMSIVTGAIHISSNILAFDRPASVERSQWLRGIGTVIEE